ncbi:MAG: diaminopimelate epimerase [Clostridiales bacterium]|jgi:diaminopimelate epimerase|nr:diaminopimelate epimerase [Clostridiales bacterium]
MIDSRKVKFTKMHGCGNNFIIFDCLNNKNNNKKINLIIKNINKLCNINIGIGADGIVFILNSNIADAAMKIFNKDGSEAKMCGNAIRCVAKYMFDNLINKNIFNIETLSGIKKVWIEKDCNKSISKVKVDMGKVIMDYKLMPVNINFIELKKNNKDNFIVSENLYINNYKYLITCVSLGNYHCVIFKNDLNFDLSQAKLIEHHKAFPDGINVEFVKIIDNNNIEIRVWERGVGETFSCGTGSCASVVAAVLNGYCKTNTDILVKNIGGDLTINYQDKNNIFMTGTATKIFDGIFYLDSM